MEEQDLLAAFDEMFDKLEESKDGVYDMVTALKKYQSLDEFFIGMCTDTINLLNEYRTHINRSIDKVKNYKKKAEDDQSFED
jgi:ribosome-associated translation inhibitor RaiA